MHEFLLTRERPPQAGALAASAAFAWRSVRKIKHVPDTMFDAVVQPIVFLVLVTYGFGGAIAGSPREYLQFFTPGVALLAVVMISMSTGFAMNKDMASGLFDRVRTLPVRPLSVLTGPILADTVRYLLSTVVAVSIGLLLGFRPSGGVLGVLLAALFLQLFAFSLSWVWTWIGIVARAPGTAESVIMMVNSVVLFGSSILAPVETMPGWVRFIVQLNPVSHAADVTRGLMHGTITMSQLWVGLLLCAGLSAVFAPLALGAFTKRRRVG
ncbi:ABC transporter permease [Nocardia transvalensis]|nr:ABC transporter permease [Nocardia transvalensis]